MNDESEDFLADAQNDAAGSRAGVALTARLLDALRPFVAWTLATRPADDAARRAVPDGTATLRVVFDESQASIVVALVRPTGPPEVVDVVCANPLEPEYFGKTARQLVDELLDGQPLQ